MSHSTHDAHEHQHGPGCGHAQVAHGDHTDFLHDGHLHHRHDRHVDEHVLEESEAHPAACTPEHHCAGHGPEHAHDEACAHASVPHGDHVDYLAEGHLHRPHGDHCDHHGRVTAA